MRRARRCKGDEALLEGPHLVGEALDAGLELACALATPGFLRTAEGAAMAGRAGDLLEPVREDLLAAVMDADSPRGVAAVARLLRPGAAALPRRRGGVYLYLEGLQDPGNLGALVRTAEAAGVAGVALSPGCVHPNHPRALRASAGSLLRAAVAVGVHPGELERHLGEVEPRWVALATRGGTPLWDEALELGGTLVLALGAEGAGLSGELERRAAVRVTVPVEAPVESLNATVAAALVLFEVRRRESNAVRTGPS